ncbi:MAG: response regulator transcription factor [Leptolyngbyaceae cyanobacterium SL_7_1]|nr:response regulator transcription factor [Leptolyngbyaceae cyanobacterium SL_7_1]
MTRVLIAARAITQAGLAALLADSSVEPVGVASPQTLVAQIEALQPDVVLMEGELEELGGELGTIASTLPAIVLLDPAQSTEVGEWLQLGVRGVLPKASIASEIIPAIDAVAAGLIVLHPDFTSNGLLLSSLYPSPQLDSQRLTPREVEVLGMLAEGLGNRAIAQRLMISEHTVKFHISSIFSKLQVTSRTEAVIVGARMG